MSLSTDNARRQALLFLGVNAPARSRPAWSTSRPRRPADEPRRRCPRRRRAPSRCGGISRTSRCRRTTAGRSASTTTSSRGASDHQLHLHQLHRHLSADVREPGARAGDARRSHRPRHLHHLAVSIDPEHDTPAGLAEYARNFNARPGWTFATGRIEDINNIRRRLGLYDSEDITQHMGLLTFGNEPKGKWGATPALDTPKNILYYVLRRVDPFQYTVWPTVTPAPRPAAERSGDAMKTHHESGRRHDARPARAGPDGIRAAGSRRGAAVLLLVAAAPQPSGQTPAGHASSRSCGSSSPYDDETVSGTVTIDVDAYDASGIGGVDLRSRRRCRRRRGRIGAVELRVECRRQRPGCAHPHRRRPRQRGQRGRVPTSCRSSSALTSRRHHRRRSITTRSRAVTR